MHGGVTGWEVDAPDTFNTPAGQKAYGKMVADHSPGGKEPLVRIGDGDPKGVWYEPATPRAGAPDADPSMPGPRRGPDVDTKVRDDIEAATGVKKDADYEQAQRDLRLKYAREMAGLPELPDVPTPTKPAGTGGPEGGPASGPEPRAQAPEPDQPRSGGAGEPEGPVSGRQAPTPDEGGV